ncbi:MAG: 50S ribosomal protein L18 [Euryarchaeota archaeon]|nr:50S ribosomal protein L18 [Euryarchaeota archaeon]|tara:strand:- start:7285 stop:7794 length:510 start_codon:yes stop_codon:yes gene_type:complete
MRGTQRRSIFRRRKAGLTDYRRRLKLLRGRKPRAVVRISNTRTTCQLVDWAASGDLVKISMTGSDLTKKFGWPETYSQKSVPASYLVGFAMGKAALAQGADEAVLDIGLAASTAGNRVFAALKGMVDAGLEVPHSDSVLPDEDRLNGVHINGDIAKAVETTKTTIEGAY